MRSSIKNLIGVSGKNKKISEEMSELSGHWAHPDSDDEDLAEDLTNRPVSGDRDKYETNEQWEYDASPTSSSGGHEVANNLLDLQAVEATEDSMEGRGEVYLEILRQPEDTHRARYMSEGSRGAIKDQSGTSHCTIQLVGYNRPTGLQIFAGTATDPIKPHPFYRLIPVTGKGSGQTTKCRDVTAHDGIQCIEVMLRPERDMTALLDCVGILKMCSAETKRRRGKSTTASTIRLVFRVHVPLSQDGTDLTKLQVLSTPIYCGQQLGYPEIRRVSRSSATVRGGAEIFVIGRNFDKNARAQFREYDSDGQLVWNADALMENDYLSQCHMIFATPAYRDLGVKHNVEVTMTIDCGSKTSHPMPFTYTPEPTKEVKRIRDVVALSTSDWTDTPNDGNSTTGRPAGNASIYATSLHLPVVSVGNFGNNSAAMPLKLAMPSKQSKSRKRPLPPQSPTLTKILQSLEQTQSGEEALIFGNSLSSETSPGSDSTVDTIDYSGSTPVDGNSVDGIGQEWTDLALMSWNGVGIDVAQINMANAMISNVLGEGTIIEMEARKPHEAKYRRTNEMFPMSPLSASGDERQWL